MQNHLMVCSKADPAGSTMLESLKDNFGFLPIDTYHRGQALQSKIVENVRLFASDGNLLEMDDLDELYPSVSSFVFLSKHKSESALPTLTCHSTGNFGINKFGGRAKELAIAFPSLQKAYMKALAANHKTVPNYDIRIEATHHGPTSLRKPTIFLELGSSQEQWSDKNAAFTICSTALAVLRNEIPRCSRVAIAIGGTHYPSKLNRLLVESDIGFAAIASKHNLDDIDKEMLDQMITKSSERVTHAAIDNKGLNGQRTRIIRLVTAAGLEIILV